MSITGLKKRIEKLKASEMFKNIMRISSGTLIGQVLSVVLIPVITRIYGDAAIGVWAFLNTIITIVCSFSDLGLRDALMVEEDEASLRQTYKVATTSTLVAAILSGVLAFLFFEVISPGGMTLTPILAAIFVCAGVIMTQQTQISYTWLNRDGKYKILMKNPIVNAGFFGILAITFGLAGMGLYGYLLAWALAQLITLLHMRRYLPDSFVSFKFSDFREVCSRNRRYVMYQLPANIVMRFKGQLPALLIGSLFGASILGQYSITVRVTEMPVTLLGTSIGRVFFQKSSELKREGKPIGELNYKLLTNAMKIALVPVVLLAVFGDIVFTWVLGAEWQMAGNMVRILALQSFFTFLMMSSQGLSMTLNKQHYSVVSGVVQSVFIIIALYFGRHYFDNIYIAIAIISVSFIINQIVLHCLRFRVMGMPIKKLLIRISIYLFIMLVGYIVLRFTLYYLGVVNTM